VKEKLAEKQKAIKENGVKAEKDKRIKSENVR